MTRQTAIDVLLGLVVMAWLVVVGVYLGQAGSHLLGLEPGTASHRLVILAGLVTVAFLAKQRLPLTRQLKASVDVEAASSVVWDAVYPRARYEYFSATVDAIEPVEGEPHLFRYIGTDIDADGSRAFFHVRVLDTDPGRGFSAEAARFGDDDPLGNLTDRVDFAFEPLGPDRTRVYLCEELQNLSFLGFVFLVMGNPPRDYLIQLKAYCEGAPDRSYAGALLTASRGQV